MIYRTRELTINSFTIETFFTLGSHKILMGRKADPEFSKKLDDFRTSMLAPRKPPLYDL